MRRHLRPATAVEALVLVLLAALVAVCFWPGHMDADTLTTIDQVRRHDIGDRHSALLEALWVPLWDVGVGPGWVLAAQAMTFVVGAQLILRTVLRPLIAVLVVVVVTLLPQVFGMLGLVGRDAWFTALLLATFGLVCTAAARPRTGGRARIALLVVALPIAWLALASRQNAAPAVLLAMIAWAAVALGTRRPRSAWRRAGAAVGVGVLVTAALGATQLAALAVLQPQAEHPEQYVFEYDLAAISRDERRDLFPRDVLPHGDMAVIDRYWDPDTGLPYVAGPGAPITTFLDAAQARSLSRAWRSAVRAHPGDYLAARATLFERQLAITRAPKDVFHPVIDPNPFGLKVRFPGLDRTANRYVEAFADANLDGDALFRAWAYLLAGVAAAIYLLRPRRMSTLRACLGALALSGLAYQVGLFFAATGVNYRFEYPAVVTSLLAVVAVVADLVGRRAAAGSRRGDR